MSEETINILFVSKDDKFRSVIALNKLMEICISSSTKIYIETRGVDVAKSKDSFCPFVEEGMKQNGLYLKSQPQQLTREDFNNFDYMFAFDNYTYEACLAIRNFTVEKTADTKILDSSFEIFRTSKEPLTLPNQPNNCDDSFDEEINELCRMKNQLEMSTRSDDELSKGDSEWENEISTISFGESPYSSAKSIVTMEEDLFEDIETILNLFAENDKLKKAKNSGSRLIEGNITASPPANDIQSENDREEEVVNNLRTNSDNGDNYVRFVDAINGIDGKSMMEGDSYSDKSNCSFDDNDYCTRALLCLLTAYDSPDIQTDDFEIYERSKAMDSGQDTYEVISRCCLRFFYTTLSGKKINLLDFPQSSNC
ncbi:DgyrCDS9526 [Dimorphilus gyrociliatus]|uniref:DgyrCDS9526 n=1 Tax=Dimorphilus gyrociliatus TaxID=2664684 RepID=A0A7I8VXL7_9ANNE|nr:DgyrCDS9526 [Dimorphilus gyrociliatus]